MRGFWLVFAKAKTDRSCFAVWELSKVLFFAPILLAFSRFANKMSMFLTTFDNFAGESNHSKFCAVERSL
jgi:hypothetical protein